MSLKSLNLRKTQSRDTTSEGRAPLLGELLVADGVLSPDDLEWALPRQKRHLSPIGHVLIQNGKVSELDVYAALARQYGTTLVRPGGFAPNFPAIDLLGAEWCLRNAVLPLGHVGAATLIATSQPHRFEVIRARIEDACGPVIMQVMPASELERAVARARRQRFALGAETRSPDDQSTRTMIGRGRWIIGLAVLALFCAAVSAVPVAALGVLCALSVLVLLINTGLLIFATYFGLGRPVADTSDPLIMARLPQVSLLLPLFKERDIAGALIGRISRIDYPRELLDVALVVEAGDIVTQETLANTDLPPWMRVVSVPPGQIQTKPRAMNYALDFCDGAIIGIYDAEDAPAPDQIMRVVQQFARSAPEVACLQGRLNFYNAKATWLSRCFTVDYSTWFCLVLPALRRLGWPIPLGGTTVFFRRSVLEEVGAWDAHNVTEDADLGMRLARRGYLTDLLDSTTLEEATTRPLPWIKQRSRWLKGYAITYAVHMRDPRALVRDLGLWGFFGFQVLFLCSLSSTILAPLLWTFWLPVVGVPHPVATLVPPIAILALMAALFFVALLGMASNATALIRMRRGYLLPWLPAMHIYYPLATIAMVKALVELLVCPFFWDKTAHGVSPPDQPLPKAAETGNATT